MRGSLGRLHRDEGAQVSFLAVAAALCFVALLAMVMNSNDMVRQRIRMQEVADVTALSAANWNARGMNLVSMVNVINSKLLTMTVLVNSLNKTLPIVKQVAVAQGAAFKACTGVPIVGVFCGVMAVVVKVQEKIIRAMEKVIKNIAKFTACKKAVWTIMESLQQAAEGVRNTFPAIGIASAVDIATRNGASFGVAVNGGPITGGSPAQALTLPATSTGYKTSDFCSAMKVGGPGYVMEGYDSDQGPVRLGKKIWDLVFIPFFNLLPHPIFYGFYSYYMTQIGCTPDPESDEQAAPETTFYDLPACRKYDSEATWERFESRTDWVANGNWTTDDFVAWESMEAGQGDGPPEDDMDKFGDLGKYGEGAPVPGSNPAPARGPGYSALVSERNTDSAEVPCDPDDSSSGYPASNAGLFGLGCLVDSSNCQPLQDNPDYTRYSGTTHQANPSAPDAERTGVYFMKAERESRQQDDGNGNQVTRYRYNVDVWVLADSGTEELDEDELDEYVQSQGGDSTKPGDQNDGANAQNCKNVVQPLLLDTQQNPYNRLRHISLVYIELGGDNPLPFWSSFFDSPPRRIAAYAQAQVYNKLSEDMFTQDWRVRLEQASLLEAALGSDQGFSLEGAGNIAQEFIGSVNNH